LRDRPWDLVLDTKLEAGFLDAPRSVPGAEIVVGARSLVLLMAAATTD
jgi:hypothetical protein